MGINNAGQIVLDSDLGAVLYTNGVFAPIEVPGATYTSVAAINNLGQTAGIFGGSNGLLFVDAGGVFTTLEGPSPAIDLRGINDQRKIVGSYNPLGTTFVLGFLGIPIPEPASRLLCICGLAVAAIAIGRRRCIHSGDSAKN
jgi:hypothetical protein